MIVSVLRALWRRRRSEALVILEVLATFLVVALVATFAALLADRARRPLGFDATGVLRIEALGIGTTGEELYRARSPQLLEALAKVPGVESAAGAGVAPWEQSDWVQTDDDGLRVQVNWVTPELVDVLQLEIVAGRFFEEADAALAWRPVVINLDLAQRLFGDQDPIGRPMPDRGAEAEQRVVGVVSDFREDGELGAPMFYLFRLSTHPSTRQTGDLLVRLAPDAGATTERAIVELLRELAPEWSFEVRSLAEIRRRSLRMTLAPLVLAVAAAVFLLGTVGLGLTGVVWQNVSRRTRELGLRRAIGASRANILGQVVLEVVVLNAVGVVLGALVLVQLPLFGFGSIVPHHLLGLGAIFGAVVVVGLGLICAVYPGRLAMRVVPAEALRRG